MDCSPPGFSCPRILPARILEWIPFPSPGFLPNPGIEPRYPTLKADSSVSQPPGKPKPNQKFSVFNTRCLAAATEITTLFLKIHFFFDFQDTLITLFPPSNLFGYYSSITIILNSDVILGFILDPF